MDQKTVLVVEDEPAIRSLLSLVIETRDYRVVTAQDGREALARVERDRPDAILLDLMLPNVDGWAVLDELHRNAATACIPIIVMSASHRLDAAREHGAIGVLGKPFDIPGLLRLLEDALSGPQATPYRSDASEPGRSFLSRMLEHTRVADSARLS
jgi:CheY-like chemotaxis protein